MRSLFLLLLAVACGVSAFGQDRPKDSIAAAGVLINKGSYSQAISLLNATLNSTSLSDLERGRGQMLLGIASKESGQLRVAEQQYELALETLKDYPDSQDYARTLACLGGLKRDTGDLKLGRRFLLQALELESRNQDHMGLGWTNLHLAGVAIRQKNFKAAEKYIQDAREESLLSNPIPGDLLADIEGTRGWLDTARGHVADAVSDYANALDQSKAAFGPQHPVSGWAYLLLGRARAANGDITSGLNDMRTGLEIIRKAEGNNTTVLAYGELAYATVLDQAGSHSEATKLDGEARELLSRIPQGPCMNCTVTAWSLGYR